MYINGVLVHLLYTDVRRVLYFNVYNIFKIICTFVWVVHEGTVHIYLILCDDVWGRIALEALGVCYSVVLLGRRTVIMSTSKGSTAHVFGSSRRAS